MGACFSCSQAVSAVDADGGGGSGGDGSNTFSMPSSRGIASISWNESSMKNKRERERNGGWVGSDRRSDAVSDGVGPYEYELHRVPGRLFLNSTSEVACLFTQQGKKGTNQDAMLVWENFSSRNDTIFCGVFDGHGPLGHFVSKKVRDSLPLKLYSQWRGNSSSKVRPHENGFMPRNINSAEAASISIDDEHSETLEVDDSERLPEMYLTLKQSLLKAFKLMDEELKLHPTIDCFCSGTTAVTVIKQGRDIVIGNVGDSRAILGTRDKDNSMVAVQLTVDLKPNLPREAARIQQCRGRVFSLQDEPEVARVWLPNNDSPGLAMARAFGDFCLKDYGLISVPDISYRHLSEKDEFIVLATDGIWDVLSNKEVVDIVSSAPSRGTAARALVDSAVRAWKLKFPTSKIDDCAAVCLFLDIPKSPSHETKNDLKETPKNNSKGANVEQMETDSDLENQATIGNEIHESVPCSAQVSPRLSNTLFDADEIEQASDEHNGDRVSVKSQSARRLADCISTAEEEEWSALQGISRVNSLVRIPRFSSSLRRSSSSRRWM